MPRDQYVGRWQFLSGFLGDAIRGFDRGTERAFRRLGSAKFEVDLGRINFKDRRNFNVMGGYLIRIAGGLFAASILVGCAGVEFQEVTKENDHRVRGLRYYDSAPYLIIQSNNQGGINSQLVYLPDTSTVMSARPYSFLATSKSSLSFDGYFTGMQTESDATAVPEAVIKALGEVARTAVPAISGALADDDKVEPLPAPYIFKLVPEGGTIRFVGGQAMPGTINPGLNGFTEVQATAGVIPKLPTISN